MVPVFHSLVAKYLIEKLDLSFIIRKPPAILIFKNALDKWHGR